MRKKARPFIISILLTVGVGALAGFLTKDGMSVYQTIAKPSLSPPGILFPIVWTILFILMGIGAALVYRSDSYNKKHALWIYGMQLIVNFFWSILFFNMRAYLSSFLWLILLLLFIIAMIVEFHKVNRCAALLQIPYLLWVAFAGYLNFMVWQLNH